MSWDSGVFPERRAEAHYNDRVVECFSDRPQHLWQFLSDAVARNPNGEAYVSGTRRVSWRNFLAESERVALALSAQGVRKGDRVGILMGNSIDFIAMLFGLFRLGAVGVPVSVRASVPEIAFMLSNCGAELLVCDRDLTARSSEAVITSDGRLIAFPDLDGEGTLSDPDEISREEEVALVLYTSGTTGKPKGAMLTHLGLIHAGVYYQTIMGFQPEDRVISAVPLSHVTGIAALIAGPMHGSATVILMEAFKAAAFLDLAEVERMTYTLMVPAMYNLCLLQPDFADRDLGTWRLAAYGGAPMPEPTIRRLAEAIPALSFANCYGSTETILAQLVTPRQYAYEKREFVGCALPGTEARIMDENGRELPHGSTGEIWLRGPNVVRGYWNNPEATAASFTAGFWHSGDIGVMDEDGFVRVLDRAKDMINRGGLKVYSAELENVLTDHPAVVEAAAIAKPCPVLGERVHAVVTIRSAIDAVTLREWCSARLSDYKVPETLDLWQNPLPRNANGKVDKKLLRDSLLNAAP
ncbi:class I adenylate-forming enzyme family protein [Paracoccus aerodenitrificans]|uniref:class I adenylate-forming enzyme family protein n=1 Tax=Paracoccus aerodenitrificans TaxID=3017781 RepID=UPI0022F10572|nr:class I adenylate-forming enzyme family protein [Paracoccus aerodenitrificans]WBU62749.1 class I adenylate-forming enzyme family protein [Paracoccus aerodenitrificans]